MSSIFSQIIKGNIPAVVVYDTEKSMAIMDICPIQPGQILVFPKTEVPTVWDLETDAYGDLMMTVKKVAEALKAHYHDQKIGLIIEGLEVTDHAHVKVFPFSSVAEFHAQPKKRFSEAELKRIAAELNI